MNKSIVIVCAHAHIRFAEEICLYATHLVIYNTHTTV